MTAESDRRESERTMLDRLNVRYGKFNGNGIRYTRAEHVKIATGFEASRICDFMSMDLWGGYGVDRGPKLNGHEVKISRADWLAEIKDPEKAESFARYCDYWWLVIADKMMVREGELPWSWGLMVPYGRSLRVVKQAEKRIPDPMPRSLQATLTRAVTKTTIRLTRGASDGGIEYLAGAMRVPALTPGEVL